MKKSVENSFVTPVENRSVVVGASGRTAAVGSAEVGADSGQRSSFGSGWILLVLRIVE